MIIPTRTAEPACRHYRSIRTFKHFSGILILLIIPVIISGGIRIAAAQWSPTSDDLRLLKICRGITGLFESKADIIWPGYSLAEQPYIVYSPERWALLINSSEAADGFTAYPPNWPSLGTNARYYEGRYDGLAGQLKFNLPLGGTRVVAVGFHEGYFEGIEYPDVRAFSYIVHEAFHQYQCNVFGEIPWAREEKYPISDLDNGALAWLEMRILLDALESAKANDRERCMDLTKMFLSVRGHRWENGNDFISEYEQGKELSEGTAKYVELKCVELMHHVGNDPSSNGTVASLAGLFPGIGMPELLQRELKKRMGEACLQPEDIPRNRIYAVAATQGFLLDYFGIEWKSTAQKAGPGFTYAGLLATHLDVDEGRFDELIDRAKSKYDYEDILAATTQAAHAYQLAFNNEMRAFEAQDGVRIELVMSSSGLSRSRVSRVKKWLADDGRFLLCSHFKVYTLRGKDWSLELHDAGLLEINDWNERIKTVVFYNAGVDSMSFDGIPVNPLVPGTHDFKSFELRGNNFFLKGGNDGKFITKGKMMRLHLAPN